MLTVANLTKRYGGKRGFLALENISLEVAEGQVFGLVGYNGAGKTTLLKTIAGVCQPSAGRVLYDGQARNLRPGDLFIVADEPYFLSQASPRMMVRFYGGYYPHFSDAVFERLLDAFGLDGDARIEGFSKGMQRQCGLALGLASGARILLLDESFDGLDLGKRKLLKHMVRVYAKARCASVIVTSHNLLEIEDVADELGMIDGCHLVFCGALADVQQTHPGQNLEEIFLSHGRHERVDVEAIFA